MIGQLIISWVYKKTVVGLKTELWDFLKPTKDYSKPERVKTVYSSGKKQLEEIMIKSIRNLFKLKTENKAIKNRIIRDIKTIFEQ